MSTYTDWFQAKSQRPIAKGSEKIKNTPTALLIEFLPIMLEVENNNHTAAILNYSHPDLAEYYNRKYKASPK